MMAVTAIAEARRRHAVRSSIQWLRSGKSLWLASYRDHVNASWRSFNTLFVMHHDGTACAGWCAAFSQFLLIVECRSLTIFLLVLCLPIFVSEVEDNASIAELRVAYRRALLKAHPDRGLSFAKLPCACSGRPTYETYVHYST